MITEELERTVVNSVLEQGALTKQQVTETWDINDADYTELQRRVLKSNGIKKGPKGAGGFVALKRMGKFPDEAFGDVLLTRAEWEEQTVDRLSKLLPHSTLEDLLGGCWCPRTRSPRRRPRLVMPRQGQNDSASKGGQTRYVAPVSATKQCPASRKHLNSPNGS